MTIIPASSLGPEDLRRLGKNLSSAVVRDRRMATFGRRSRMRIRQRFLRDQDPILPDDPDTDVSRN